MSRLLAWTLAGLFGNASCAVAQMVWTVTAATGIDAAIAAASPGDVIVLQPGAPGAFFEPFDLNKGVTVRGGGARVGYQPSFTKYQITVAVPPGQVAHIENLDLTLSYSPYGSGGTPVVVAGGAVHLEDCDLRVENGTALSISGAEVTVSSSSLTALNRLYGNGIAIGAMQSNVTLRDCEVVGGNASCHPVGCFVSQNPAQVGVSLLDSTLHAERCAFRGGDHAASFSATGATAIELFNSSAWISDSTMTGGLANGSRAPALVNHGTAPVDLRNLQLLAGTPAPVGPVNPGAPLVRLAVDPAWQRGMASTLLLSGDPGAPFLLAVTPGDVSASLSIIVERIWLSGAQVAAGGVLDASGAATLAVAVPNTPALEHAVVRIQAVSGATLPLRATALAGGIIR